ncbi:hypothetical protein CDAR_186481 [Caerostris darwini]|uniref:Uncharacterized protein n=1 Tax=Caerostris darwini TaxID=1538125 RepID=A0AAV4VTS0_9ARAC|nr:hypothetical protein CDAR_186481 [Caerostris darwini]
MPKGPSVVSKIRTLPPDELKIAKTEYTIFVAHRPTSDTTPVSHEEVKWYLEALWYLLEYTVKTHYRTRGVTVGNCLAAPDWSVTRISGTLPGQPLKAKPLLLVLLLR